MNKRKFYLLKHNNSVLLLIAEEGTIYCNKHYEYSTDFIKYLDIFKNPINIFYFEFCDVFFDISYNDYMIILIRDSKREITKKYNTLYCFHYNSIPDSSIGIWDADSNLTKKYELYKEDSEISEVVS